METTFCARIGVRPSRLTAGPRLKSLRPAACFRVFVAIWAAASALAMAATPAAAVTVVGSLTHVFEAGAGGAYDGSVELRNPGTAPIRVRLHVRDYSFNDAESFYSPPGSHERSAGPWLSLSATEAVLGPGDGASVAYRISVPDDDALRGTYWAVIMVEGVGDEPIADEPPAGPTGIRLQAAVLYSIQVVVNVDEAARPRLRLQSAALAPTEGEAGWSFEVDAFNDGERWIRPRLRLELYRDDGETVGVFPGAGRRLYPGTGRRQFVPLPIDLAGSYVALLVLDGGGQDVFAARFDFDVPAGD